MHTEFWLESLKGRHHSEGLGIDGRIILKWVLKKQGQREWIHLAEDRDQWWALMSMVVNLQGL
jgi:hypothetical protein